MRPTTLSKDDVARNGSIRLLADLAKRVGFTDETHRDEKALANPLMRTVSISNRLLRSEPLFAHGSSKLVAVGARRGRTRLEPLVRMPE